MSSWPTPPEDAFVLVTGSPATGFVLTGPFPTREAAALYIGPMAQACSWWILPLFKPKE